MTTASTLENVRTTSPAPFWDRGRCALDDRVKYSFQSDLALVVGEEGVYGEEGLCVRVWNPQMMTIPKAKYDFRQPGPFSRLALRCGWGGGHVG
jgi:hypothetical protein